MYLDFQVGKSVGKGSSIMVYWVQSLGSGDMANTMVDLTCKILQEWDLDGCLSNCAHHKAVARQATCLTST